ncbi:MAG: Rrf2 family transcriptional regulator [Rhodospirillales bacterium]|nr:Rrf2 family transcriptional regulator [Rhodospirillales bacterium]
MLSLTRKSDYALVALAYLGKNRQEQRTPVSARHIAELFGLPLPLLMNILKELSQAKLLESTRGVRGGYALAIDPKDVSLLEIVTAIEGPLQFAQCAEGLPVVGQGCTLSEGCPIRGPVRKLHERIARFLEETTLQDLLEGYDVDAEQRGAEARAAMKGERTSATVSVRDTGNAGGNAEGNGRASGTADRDVANLDGQSVSAG